MVKCHVDRICFYDRTTLLSVGRPTVAHRCFQDVHVGGQRALRPLQNRVIAAPIGDTFWRITRHYDTEVLV